MIINIIAAVDRNFLIGTESGLPWKLPADLKRFKLLTMGKPLVMGRKTFETIGRPLPGRETIILTRSAETEFDGCAKARSAKEALQIGKQACQRRGTDELMIAGGADVYRTFLPLCERICLTFIHDIFSGTHYFPTHFRSRYDWSVSSIEEIPPGIGNSARMSFCQIDARQDSEPLGAEERLVDLPYLLKSVGVRIATRSA